MQKQTRTRRYCVCDRCRLEAIQFGDRRHPMRRLYIKQKGKWKAVGWFSIDDCGTIIKDEGFEP